MTMGRRAFGTLFCAAAAQPAATRAQSRQMPMVGFFSTRSPEEASSHTAAFLRGLGKSGHVDGRNVTIEYRWARGQYDRLPAFAAELAGLKPAVLVAGGDPSALAAKAATDTIPIVFIMGADPVRVGLAARMNRPGGNATGVSMITSALGSKRLQLLSEMIPNAGNIGLLVNPRNANADDHIQDVLSAARMLGRQLLVLRASTEADFQPIFARLAQEGAGGLVVHNDPFFDSQRERLVALAARHRIPAIYHIREFPDAGGLMSYGPSLADAYLELGVQTGRVLTGVDPADLPVVQPTRFEFVVNLKTAKALDITIVSSLFTQTDDVIE